MMVIFWDLKYSEKQRQQFRTGELWRDWVEQYTNIFDKDDLRLATSQAHLGYHFFEWLAAILIYQETGFLSLVEKYGFANHNRKRVILRELVSPELFRLITNQSKGAQNPDLLVYSPDLSDWFFCEVKGPNDRLRHVQEVYFTELLKATGKQVRIAFFKQQ